jgi:hypothetical protein
MRRHAGVLVAVLTAVAMLVAASASALADEAPIKNHPPSGATFSWLPAAPHGGDDVTFTASASDSDGDALAYRWDLDNDGTFETTGRVVTTRLTRGKRKVRMVVSDLRSPGASVSKDVAVGNGAPTGTFTWGPTQPHSGDDVALDATASDPDGDAVSYAWDLDGDGTFEVRGPAAEARYGTAGRHIVALRLTDPAGAATVVAQDVVVDNLPPSAAFTLSPAAPAPGQDVELTSRASDPENGTLQLAQAWDLDGDGLFDDGGAAVVHHSFSAGEHVVRLRVTDADGRTEVAEQRLDVRAGGTVIEVSAPSRSVPAPPPALPPAAIAASAPRVVPMLPFPVVRLRGRLTSAGMVVQLLSVHAGRAARVTVRCMGRTCPRGVGRVTARRLQRWLKAGTVIEIRVTQPGRIGKYTRIVVRRGRAPQRVDRCLAPGSLKPVDCR